MTGSKWLGSANLVAAMACAIMTIVSLSNPEVALRWVGYFFVLTLFNSGFAYYNFKKGS